MPARQRFNVAIQKGFMSDVPGCVEHTAKRDEAIHVAHDLRRSACTAFLDLANLYGSVRHNLLQFDMDWYSVAEHKRRLVYN